VFNYDDKNHFIQKILTNKFPGDFMLNFYTIKYFFLEIIYSTFFAGLAEPVEDKRTSWDED